MPEQYISTDPFAGLYISTDPAAGLQAPAASSEVPVLEEPSARIRPRIATREELEQPQQPVTEVSLQEPEGPPSVRRIAGKEVPYEPVQLPQEKVPSITAQAPSFEEAMQQGLPTAAPSQPVPLAPVGPEPPAGMPSWLGERYDAMQDAMTNQFLQSMISQAKPIGTGIAAATQLQYGGLPAGGMVQPMPGETYAGTMQRVQQSQDPLLAAARAAPAWAQQQFPVSPAMAGTIPVQAAGMAGEFAPVLGAGMVPGAGALLAPAMIAAQTTGNEITQGYQARVAQGMPQEQAARQTFDTAIKSGMTAEAVWAALPGPMKHVFDRYVIDAAGATGFGRFMQGRVAKAAEGAALGATTKMSENLATGRPIHEGVRESAGSLAVANLFFPGGKTAREQLDLSKPENFAYVDHAVPLRATERGGIPIGKFTSIDSGGQRHTGEFDPKLRFAPKLLDTTSPEDKKYYKPASLLGTGIDPKTVKGEKFGVRTYIMYLAAHEQSGLVNVCKFATEDCAGACLGKGGMGSFDSTKLARINKTKFWHYDPDVFMAQMDREITRAKAKAKDEGIDLAIRLNGTSDILWEKTGIMEKHPDVQFYDYTKYPAILRKDLPDNYHLTYSYTGLNGSEAFSRAWNERDGTNTAVVFGNGMPAEFMGRPVIDGDVSDLRFLDPKGVIVGLHAKGPALKIIGQSKFIYPTPPEDVAIPYINPQEKARLIKAGGGEETINAFKDAAPKADDLKWKRGNPTLGLNEGAPEAGAKPRPLSERAALLRSETSEAGFVSTDHLQAALDFGRDLYQSGMDYATWAGQMIRHLGNAIREHLGNIWGAITDLRAYTEAGKAPVMEARIEQAGAPETLAGQIAYHGTNTEISGRLRPSVTPDDQFRGISLHPDPSEAGIYASEKVAKSGGKPVVTEYRIKGNLADWRELNDALGDDNFNGAKVTKWLKDNGYVGVDYTSDPMLGYGIRVMDSSALEPTAIQGRTHAPNPVEAATQGPPDADAPIMGGPGTPGATEIPEARTTGLRNAIVDKERADRGWLPLMQPAREAMGEQWDKAMQVLEKDPGAGSNLVNEVLYGDALGRKTPVDAVDHAVLAHERITTMNEAAMEAERASDMSMTEQERDEAHVRWGILEDRLNEIDQALRQAGTVTGRALQFRQALIRDDYTFAGMSRTARAQLKRPLTFEESAEIQKKADEIAKVEGEAQDRQTKVTEKESTKQAKDELRSTGQRVSQTKPPPSLDAQHTKLLTAIAAHISEGGSLSDMRPLIQKLAENYYRRGVTKLQPMLRALHETVKGAIPGLTLDDMRELFSGYGDYRPLNKDAIKVGVRELKGQAREAAKIRDMIAGQAPKKSGMEQGVPSALERRLTTKVNELKKQGGFTVSDPATQLKSTLAAIQTRLKNQIIDLSRQILTGERPPDKGAIDYDVETQKLQALRDQVRQSLAEITPRPEITDAQRLTSATNAASRNLDYWNERLRLAKQGVFKIDRETGKPISDPQLDAIKARIEAAKAEVSELHDIANPAKSPAEKALASYQARLINRMAELQDKNARGDFTTTPRTPKYTLDPETQQLQAQAQRMKDTWDQGVARKRLADREWWEKGLEGISKWRRAFVLTWPTVLGKLTTSAGYLMGSSPLEELVRSGYRVALPGVAGKAARYGRGFHLQTEAGAIAYTWKNLFNAASQDWKTGQSDLDALYGDPKLLPPELKDYVGNLHKLLKEPARLQEFYKSFQTRLWAEGRKGADITDPMVQTKVSFQAYKDANAQIFNENHAVADMWSRAMSRLKQVDKDTGRPSFGGKLAETGLKYDVPIIKIPLNVISRTFEYSFGTATGAVRLSVALARGLDKLSPDQADLIIRNLSRGNVGLAFVAMGYMFPQNFGGYYQPGEKRDPSDIAAGHARILGLDIPPYLAHSPLLAQLQIGSTIRRIVDGNVTGKQKDSPGYAAAIQQAYAGVIGDAPFVQQAKDNLKLLDMRERPKFYGQLLQSTVPGAVEWTAKHFDSDADGNPTKRHPTTPVEFWKQAVPGLRQQVPTLEEYKMEQERARMYGG